MPSSVPAKVMRVSERSASAYFGLVTHLPSTLHISTAPIGPKNGILDIASANELAIIART